MGPERQLEERILRYARSKKVLFLKLAGPMGWPDRTLIGPKGSVVFLELKAPGKTATKHQSVWLETLTSLGHKAFCTDRFEVAKMWVDTVAEL